MGNQHQRTAARDPLKRLRLKVRANAKMPDAVTAEVAGIARVQLVHVVVPLQAALAREALDRSYDSALRPRQRPVDHRVWLFFGTALPVGDSRAGRPRTPSRCELSTLFATAS